jgi:hypothetical protein
MSAAVGHPCPVYVSDTPPVYRPYWECHPAWLNEGREKATSILTNSIEMYPYGPIYPFLRPSSVAGHLAISFVTPQRTICHTLMKINPNGSIDLFHGNPPEYVNYMRVGDDIHKLLCMFIFTQTAPVSEAAVVHVTETPISVVSTPSVVCAAPVHVSVSAPTVAVVVEEDPTGLMSSADVLPHRM